MTTIVFIGDSNTAIRPLNGINTADTFAAKIAAARGFTSHINAGVGGDTSSMMLARFNADVLSYSPNAVSIMAGINDVYETVIGVRTIAAGIALLKSNLKSMVQAAKGAGINVTLMTPNLVCGTTYIDSFSGFNNAIKEVGYEENVPVVDVYRELIEAYFQMTRPNFDLYYVDYQHISALGHTLVKDLVMQSYNGSACV